jgi:hypothetical protein
MIMGRVGPKGPENRDPRYLNMLSKSRAPEHKQFKLPENPFGTDSFPNTPQLPQAPSAPTEPGPSIDELERRLLEEKYRRGEI